MVHKLLYSILLISTSLPSFSQDLRMNLYTYGNGVDKQLAVVLTNTTERLIRVRNYEGGADGSCLHMNFLNQKKEILYNSVYIFVNPDEYKRWFDVAPKQNVTFKYPIGAIRASYKKASEISSLEVFCILKYCTPNTSFSDMYDRTFTFDFQ